MTKKYFIFISFLLLQFFALAQDETLKGGELYASNFLVDNVARNFLYYMPKNYPSGDYSLLVVLHGENENSKTVYKNYGDFLQAKADSFNCILVYPDALQNGWHSHVKNASAEKDSANDIGFIIILMDYFVQRYNANAEKIYLLGTAAGGELAMQLRCIVPTKITAIAAFTQALSNESCNAKNNVAVMDTKEFTAASKKLRASALAAAWQFFNAHTKHE